MLNLQEIEDKLRERVKVVLMESNDGEALVTLAITVATLELQVEALIKSVASLQMECF